MTTKLAIVAGGGRKVALPEDEGAALREALAAGITPLEYMLDVMRNAGAEEKRRDLMAMAAAPYAHMRRGTGTGVDSHGGPVQVDIRRFSK